MEQLDKCAICAGKAIEMDINDASSVEGVRVIVDDVEPKPAAFRLKGSKDHALYSYPTATACSFLDSQLIGASESHPSMSQLLNAATLAFNGHHPLALSPDVIFDTILAGTSGTHLKQSIIALGCHSIHVGSLTAWSSICRQAVLV